MKEIVAMSRVRVVRDRKRINMRRKIKRCFFVVAGKGRQKWGLMWEDGEEDVLEGNRGGAGGVGWGINIGGGGCDGG